MENQIVDRKKLAKKTSIINLVARIITMAVQFVTRYMVLHYLGVEYLGMNSTLAQLVGTLSVSELGIQSVIIFKLYKPLVEGDRNRINQIMSIYRSLYRYVSAFIMVGSLAMTPFLKLIITNIEIPYQEIVIAWLVMSATTAASYLLSYNYAIVTADQKLYIITCAESIIGVACGCISIILLYFYHDYFLYLAVNMICTIATNLSYFFIRRRYFPWLTFEKPQKGAYKEILVTVKDGFAGKISSYIFNSTDNIVISAFIGTALVGIYGNYYTIITSMTLVMSSLINPVQAIIGNYLVKAEKKQLSKFVINYTYVVNFICSILFIPTFLLINDFVCMFYGVEYQIDFIIIVLLCIDKYIAFSLISVCSMLDAAGQFRIQKQMFFIGAVTNIVLSVIGVQLIGLPGVLLGTIVGHAYYWYKGCKNCYKVVIKGSAVDIGGYIKYNIVILVVYALLLSILYFGFEFMNHSVTVQFFIFKGFISEVVIGFTHFLIFRKTPQFKYMCNILGLDRFRRRSKC